MNCSINRRMFICSSFWRNHIRSVWTESWFSMSIWKHARSRLWLSFFGNIYYFSRNLDYSWRNLCCCCSICLRRLWMRRKHIIRIGWSCWRSFFYYCSFLFLTLWKRRKHKVSIIWSCWRYRFFYHPNHFSFLSGLFFYPCLFFNSILGIRIKAWFC